MNSNLSTLVANALVSTPNLAENLAIVIEANPIIAELLLDVKAPVVTAQHVLNRRPSIMKDHENPKIVSIEVKLSPDMHWRVDYKVEFQGYYDVQEHADSRNSYYCTRKEDERHQIKGVGIMTDNYTI